MENNTTQNQGKKLWFRAKSYGWGWYPITWQGWAVLAVYVVLMVGFNTWIHNQPDADTNLLVAFVFPFIILSGVLIAICYKYGEKPRWRWGKDDTAPKI
jgi:uncharacterized membrane protein YhaH (DUF805 family)